MQQSEWSCAENVVKLDLKTSIQRLIDSKTQEPRPHPRPALHVFCSNVPNAEDVAVC